MERRIWCLAAFLLFALPALAQFSGRVAGTVLDPSGAPVAGAEVSLSLVKGAKALVSTATGKDGSYRLLSVRAEDYDLTVAAPGFLKFTLHNLRVDAARETPVQSITLQLASVTSQLDVSANEDTVETGNAEISTTITPEQIRKLPVLDRDPLSLIQMQAGVASNGNSATTINGLRTSASNMTLDGINIQDNYVRDNALDYSPNRVLLGQVRTLTLVTSNQNSAASGGATQLAMETPSGSNALHAEVLWYNRNNDFAANDWFNNQSGTPIARLNQNQFGASLGGPIRKDKLFFYTNYEGVRTNQQSPTDTTILTADARQGIFTYKNKNTVTKVNLLAMRGISIDPYMANLLKQVPDPSQINNFDSGDSTAALLKNTAGYRFNQRSNEVRDNITYRMDFNLSPKNSFSGSYIWNRDNTDSADGSYSVIPKNSNPNHSHFVSTTWRSTITSKFTNELRGGFNLAPGDFLTSQKFGPYIVTGTVFTDPVAEFQPQGRATNTYSISDNAAYQKGTHYIQFGFHMQQVRVHEYDYSGVVPSYSLAMGTGQNALTTADLPGITNAALAQANALLATLGGYVDGYSQNFNVTSAKSGYVSNTPYLRNLKLSEYDLYVQDNWKIVPRVMLTLGLRYDLPGVADETNSLELLPVVQNNNPNQTLLSNATLNFAGASIGRPWYNKDHKDFAPNIGLAWDLFGNGKTAFRGGYAISYINDQALLAPENITGINSGLVGVSAATGLSGRVSGSLPAIPAPVYVVPRTVADNHATDFANGVGLVDPNLKTPYVQQYSAGFQHRFKDTLLEARYVGNHMVHGYRAFDLNQVQIKSNGFLSDFLRAQNNGFLAQAKTGTFNPAYNAAIPGSQVLTVFPLLAKGGSLGNGANRNLIETGQVGQLAASYFENGNNGSVSFFANPNAEVADILNNYSNSTYNSLQLSMRRQTKSGIEFQANYTYAKVLSDAAGDSQTRVEAFLDNTNTKISRARANFDLRHAIKGSATYDLPFGKGRRFAWKPLDRLIGGWSTGAIFGLQSGAPFSILSGYGTLNRANRSASNTATTLLNGSQLDQIVKFEMTGNGPYILVPSALNPADGTGTNNVGQAPYPGQVFYNPVAGTVGALQVRQFSGPWSFNLDASIQKNIPINEKHSIEIRLEGVNVLNHPSFYVGDQNINANTFGVIGSTFNSPRVIQIGARYQF
jgi:hypothetical protein